ncbi:hypothetical protein I4U23_024294 [Adineta vaga]|nr:hypothetical protein I4U23_024294 [Adineta vaga]
MKKLSSNSKAPKRSTSLVATLTRPFIERKQYEKSISPTLSFSSSILTRGMTEQMTPQINNYQSRTNPLEEQSKTLVPKSNRRRAIDFSRRRTVGGPTDQLATNKENLPNQQIYRFSPTASTNIVTKKYYFHPTTPAKNEDILMNSYGLTILQPQRQSSAPTTKKPQISQTTSLRTPPKSFTYRSSIRIPQQDFISESLEDILCDREVESYFYPNRYQPSISIPQHIYINLGNSTNHYQPPAYIHSTLC